MKIVVETKVFVVNEENNWKESVLQPALAVPIRRSNLPYPQDGNLKGILEPDKAFCVIQ